MTTDDATVTSWECWLFLCNIYLFITSISYASTNSYFSNVPVIHHFFKKKKNSFRVLMKCLKIVFSRKLTISFFVEDDFINLQVKISYFYVQFIISLMAVLILVRNSSFLLVFRGRTRSLIFKHSEVRNVNKTTRSIAFYVFKYHLWFH